MKKIPEFQSEHEEQEFWATADSTQYVDWKKGKKMLLPSLKPSVKTISLRLPNPVAPRAFDAPVSDRPSA